jgi:hypothetical protein
MFNVFFLLNEQVDENRIEFYNYSTGKFLKKNYKKLTMS